MRLAVTIITPPDRHHSAAFAEVAESVHHGLARLGYDVVRAVNADVRGRRLIVLGANLLPSHPVDLPPDSILYNLEQVAPDSPWMNPEAFELLRRHTVWDYSPANVRALAELGIEARHVPIGYAPVLSRIRPAQEDVDVLFYGSVNERRRLVLRALAARGLKVRVAHGVYGPARDALIARSRLVLNLHYYESRVFEIVRVSYLLANRRAVVSERGLDPELEAPFESGVAFADYDELADRCVELVADPGARRALAAAGFEVMRRRPVIACLQGVLPPPPERLGGRFSQRRRSSLEA